MNATLHGKGDFADVIEVTDINNLGGPNVITSAFKKMEEECRRVGERDVKREKGRKYLKHKRDSFHCCWH